MRTAVPAMARTRAARQARDPARSDVIRRPPFLCAVRPALHARPNREAPRRFRHPFSHCSRDGTTGLWSSTGRFVPDQLAIGDLPTTGTHMLRRASGSSCMHHAPRKHRGRVPGAIARSVRQFLLLDQSPVDVLHPECENRCGEWKDDRATSLRNYQTVMRLETRCVGRTRRATRRWMRGSRHLASIGGPSPLATTGARR